MAVLYNSNAASDDGADAWREALGTLDPAIDFRVWPDTGAVADIEFVLAWKPKSGDLARYPNHPLVRERLHELEAQERSVQGGSGTRQMPRKSSHAPPPMEDRSFDIAASLIVTPSIERLVGLSVASFRVTVLSHRDV